MIDISIYQQRLKALEVYMSIWVDEKHCILNWWDMYNETGILLDRCEWLPSFEDWYYEWFINLYKITN